MKQKKLTQKYVEDQKMLQKHLMKIEQICRGIIDQDADHLLNKKQHQVEVNHQEKELNPVNVH